METLIVLDLVANLCKTLEGEQIDYCHWKSNSFLNRSASGENDLDLLITQEHKQRFVEILSRLGFKESLSPKSESLPGVRDFYGLDKKSGCLVHVHAHFQLILGSDLSKNYHMPMERAYLESSVQQGLFRVPAPEFELVVLVIRMVLKHSTWDVIFMKHGQLSKTERYELEDLSTEEALSKVEMVFHHLPGLDQNLFDLCLQSLQPVCPYWKRIRAGKQLQKALRTCARYPRWLDITLKFAHRIWQPIQIRLFRFTPKNRFASGGLLVAVVGGDGAGKTTMVSGLFNWLSKNFEIKKFHMGKPSWSLLTIVVRGILKFGTVLRFYPFEGDVFEESFQPHGFPWFFRAVCTARDRYLTYIRARRSSTNGNLVICDRYSLMEFMNMDGPQCELAMTDIQRKNRFLKFLANREKHYYQQINLPDLLIVLILDPEISIQRKAEETEASVRARSSEVWNLDWEKLSGIKVDSSKSKEETLSQVKALVWEHL